MEATNDVGDNEILSDYHPTMYEITERRKSNINTINRLPSTGGHCPFSGL